MENKEHNPRSKFSVILPEMMHYDIKLLAHKQRTTISAIVEELIAEYLKKHA